MEESFKKILQGYNIFRKKYATGNNSVMERLAHHGQRPEIMFVACCDSRTDPSLILQCAPGDLFTVRNVANIVPPYEKDEKHHGTSAALEFGVCHLNVKHLIILGHSQCAGMSALLDASDLNQNDFISRWVSSLGIESPSSCAENTNVLAKQALTHSYENCMTFPWIKTRVLQKKLAIHLWFFDVKQGEVFEYSFDDKQYTLLNSGAKASI